MVLVGALLASPFFAALAARLFQPLARNFLGIEWRLAADNLVRSPGRTGLVIGALARQCRGLVDLWCASGAALPPPAAVDWQFQWNLVEWVALDRYLLPVCDLAPPVPPPRV